MLQNPKVMGSFLSTLFICMFIGGGGRMGIQKGGDYDFDNLDASPDSADKMPYTLNL